MWVSTDDGGAVNTATAQQIYPIEEDDGWRLLFSSPIGTATSARLLKTRREAVEYLNQIINIDSRPPRVTEGTPDEEDTQGEGPRRTD